MTATIETDLLSKLLDPIRDSLTVEAAERIVSLRAAPEVQARLDELAEKNAEGTITPDERAEHEAIVNTATLVSLLQAKARLRLATAGD